MQFYAGNCDGDHTSNGNRRFSSQEYGTSRSCGPVSEEVQKSKKTCFRCGREGHISNSKKRPPTARNKECRKCKRLGHFAAVCRSKDVDESAGAQSKPNERGSPLKSKRKHHARYVAEDSEDESEDEVMGIYTVQGKNPVRVPMTLEDQDVLMQLDTGACVSIIPKSLFEEHFNHLPIHPSSVILRALWW